MTPNDRDAIRKLAIGYKEKSDKDRARWAVEATIQQAIKSDGPKL